jgi:hypothetical protein
MEKKTMKQRIRYLIPALVLAGILLTSIITLSSASANNLHFHYWGRAYVLGDNSTILNTTACDTGSILPLAGGNLATSLCFVPFTPSSIPTQGNSLILGNLNLDPTQPSGLSTCTPAQVLSTSKACTFYQLLLQVSEGNASVLTQSNNKTKASNTAAAKALGLTLNVEATTISPPTPPATAPTSATVFVQTLLQTTEMDSISVAACSSHRQGYASAAVAAQTLVPYNDLQIFEGGSLHLWSPNGSVNQTVVLSTTSAFFSATAILNEQRILLAGGLAAIKTNGLHIITTNPSGQVLLDFTVDTTFAALHCARHLPFSESDPLL